MCSKEQGFYTPQVTECTHEVFTEEHFTDEEKAKWNHLYKAVHFGLELCRFCGKYNFPPISEIKTASKEQLIAWDEELARPQSDFARSSRQYIRCRLSTLNNNEPGDEFNPIWKGWQNLDDVLFVNMHERVLCHCKGVGCDCCGGKGWEKDKTLPCC